MAEITSKLEVGVSEELTAALRDAAGTMRELTAEVIDLRQKVQWQEESLERTRKELLDEIWSLEKRLDLLGKEG